MVLQDGVGLGSRVRVSPYPGLKIGCWSKNMTARPKNRISNTTNTWGCIVAKQSSSNGLTRKIPLGASRYPKKLKEEEGNVNLGLRLTRVVVVVVVVRVNPPIQSLIGISE